MLHGCCDKLIRAVQIELIKHGWEKTSYSHALQILLCGTFYRTLKLQATDDADAGFDPETIRKVLDAALGRREPTQEELTTFTAWLTQLAEKAEHEYRTE